MASLFEIVAGFLKNKWGSANKNSQFVHYELIDYEEEKHLCTLKCTYTRNVFYSSIDEIVYDVNILYYLYPTQASFIGVEFAKVAQKNCPKRQTQSLVNLNTALLNRYGQYAINFLDRKRNVGFTCKKTNDFHLMDPRDIAMSVETIQEFDASHAFLIGIEAGLKIDNHVSNTLKPIPKKPKLTLVTL